MKITNNSDSKLEYSNQYILLILEELCAKYDFDGDISFKFYYSKGNKVCELKSDMYISIIQSELNERLKEYNNSEEDGYEISDELKSTLKERLDLKKLLKEHEEYLKRTKAIHNVEGGTMVLTGHAEYVIKLQTILEHETNQKTSQHFAQNILSRQLLS